MMEEFKLPSYPKVYNLGHPNISELFSDNVIIEEKIDGSQISFGVLNNELMFRSKNKQMPIDYPDNMFELAIENIKKIQNNLTPDYIYRGEYLSKPKHNTLCYDRIPDKNLILFDVTVGEETYLSYNEKKKEAEKIGLECVPILYGGKIDDFEQFKKLLDTISCLGGQKIEGVVIKNYFRFGRDGKVLMGKFVNEEFKEIHKKDWRSRNPGGKDIKFLIGENLKTEARWNKAIQHLKEKGELLNEPKDIGSLLKEVNQDVLEECSDEIKQKLFKWAWPSISKIITRGLPQWYKEKLAKEQFGQ